MNPRLKATTSDSLFTFGLRRLRDVEAAIDAVELQLGALKQERRALRELIESLAAGDTAAAPEPQTQGLGQAPRRTNSPKEGGWVDVESLPENASIKDMAIHVLSSNPGGLEQAGIGEHIAVRFGRSVQRSSVSPALHTLEKAGRLIKVEGRWSIVAAIR